MTPGPRRFGETRWTLVVSAGGPASPRAEQALAELCRLYWSPLHGFIRAQGYSSEDAEDLTQGFFERLIARRDLSAVDQTRGRFRSFLLAAVRHYISNARDHDRALKRGGGQVHMPLEASDEGTPLPEPADCRTPEAVFEQQWVETVINRVLIRLDAETAESRSPLIRHLAAPLTGEVHEVPIRDLAAELGLSDGALRVALHRLRRRFGDLLREEIAQTVVDPADVDEEIRYLLGIASRRGAGQWKW